MDYSNFLVYKEGNKEINLILSFFKRVLNRDFNIEFSLNLKQKLSYLDYVEIGKIGLDLPYLNFFYYLKSKGVIDYGKKKELIFPYLVFYKRHFFVVIGKDAKDKYLYSFLNENNEIIKIKVKRECVALWIIQNQIDQMEMMNLGMGIKRVY